MYFNIATKNKIFKSKLKVKSTKNAIVERCLLQICIAAIVRKPKIMF